jgi:hypothetical protein
LSKFFFDLKTEFPIVMASCPEILMMAMAPAPDGVASATMASLLHFFMCIDCKGTKTIEAFKLIVCAGCEG